MVTTSVRHGDGDGYIIPLDFVFPADADVSDAEYHALPSGSNEIPQDFIFFRTAKYRYYGVAALANMLTDVRAR